MTRRRFPTGFRTKCRLSEKSSEGSFRKFHLTRIFLANSSKFFRSSGSLKDLWTGEKSNPSSKTWILIPDNALWLRLKTVLEQNVSARRPSSVMVAFVAKPSDLTTELPIAKSCSKSSLCKSELKSVFHLIYLWNCLYSLLLVLNHLSYRMRWYFQKWTCYIYFIYIYIYVTLMKKS